MNLLVGFYNEPKGARAGEFIQCLERNATNPHLDTITVFVEDRMPVSEAQARFSIFLQSKIRLVAHGQRLTYKYLFGYANQHFSGAGVVIANADIFFDETLG